MPENIYRHPCYDLSDNTRIIPNNFRCTNWSFYVMLLSDDNEFEEVNIVRPDDFYQSRDADTTSSW